MTTSSESGASSGPVTDNEGDVEAETTPIAGAVQAMGESPARLRTWMKKHANGGTSATAGARMKMSNVKARVAKYEKQYREDPSYASEGCLMP